MKRGDSQSVGDSFRTWDESDKRLGLTSSLRHVIRRGSDTHCVTVIQLPLNINQIPKSHRKRLNKPSPPSFRGSCMSLRMTFTHAAEERVGSVRFSISSNMFNDLTTLC